MIRVIPDIPKIRAHWDKNEKNPVPYLMVPCSDGEVRKFTEYKEPVQQPAPYIITGERMAKMFKNNAYSYQAKHSKK